MTADVVWNDRVALYCLSLILSQGDSTVPDADVPGYLRFQCRAARQAGLGEVADALATAADAYAQGRHGFAYAILLNAIETPRRKQRKEGHMDRKLTVISDEQAKGRGIIDRLLDAGTGPDRYLCGKCGNVLAEGLGDPNFVLTGGGAFRCSQCRTYNVVK